MYFVEPPATFFMTNTMATTTAMTKSVIQMLYTNIIMKIASRLRALWNTMGTD